MKYGIISDIHSNILAFEKALKEIEKENVDKIICLGDTVGIGPYPNECVKKLISIKDKIIAVRGNHEERCIFGCPDYIHDGKQKLTEEEKKREAWSRNQLDEESMNFIKNLLPLTYIEDGKYKISIMHFPIKEDGNLKEFKFCFEKDELLDYFGEYNSDIFLFGHTHISLVSRENNKWYINPGSLGLTGFRNYGTYGILNITNDKIYYLEHYFDYDYKEVINQMKSINYPDVDNMISIFFGNK